MDALRDLVGKNNIILTKRGNKAILLALRYAKEQGFTKLCIPDAGGWITYRQYGEKLKFDVIEVESSDGLMDYSKVPSNSVLLVNCLPGYAFNQVIYDYEDLKSRGIFVILDVAGVIGMDKFECDIMVGSFGKHKPINAFYGGFIATDIEYDFESDFDMKNLDDVLSHVEKLDERLKFLRGKRDLIKGKLSDFNILGDDHDGINVIVSFDSDDEKDEIVKIVESNGFEWELCPRYIRVMRDAISVEVKRKKEN